LASPLLNVSLSLTPNLYGLLNSVSTTGNLCQWREEKAA
jgi:hypothetical protein